MFQSALYENKIVAWEWRMNYEYARQHKVCNVLVFHALRNGVRKGMIWTGC